jgi:hypothetical protein
MTRLDSLFLPIPMPLSSWRRRPVGFPAGWLARVSLSDVHSFVDVQVDRFNRFADAYSPVQLVVGTLAIFLACQWAVRAVASLRRLVARQSSGYGKRQTATRVVATIVADLPVVRGIVAREQAKVIAKLREDMRASRAETGVEPILSLPTRPTKRQRELLRMIDAKREALGETRTRADRTSKASGAVYVGDAELLKVLERVYSMFSSSMTPTAVRSHSPTRSLAHSRTRALAHSLARSVESHALEHLSDHSADGGRGDSNDCEFRGRQCDVVNDAGA